MMIFIIEKKEEKGGERQRLDVEEINRAIYIFLKKENKNWKIKRNIENTRYIAVIE